MQIDYGKLKKECERNSRLVGRTVNDFLIGYAAGFRGLEKDMERRFERFRHVLRKFDKGNVNLFKSQWIAHQGVFPDSRIDSSDTGDSGAV